MEIDIITGLCHPHLLLRCHGKHFELTFAPQHTVLLTFLFHYFVIAIGRYQKFILAVCSLWCWKTIQYS